MARKVVLGIEEASFFSMSVHRLNMFIWLGERAVGPRRCWRMGRSSKEGGVGVDGFVEFDGPACVTGAVWLGLLACVLGWYKCVSVGGCGVWGVG